MRISNHAIIAGVRIAPRILAQSSAGIASQPPEPADGR
jgi:hypothetical protein